MSTPEASTPIRYRPMTVQDVPSVYAIDLASFSLPWTERSYRFELTENKHSLCWVAEALPVDGPPQVVGMLVIWAILDEAHVATIATHPDFRGLGIGKQLLARGLLAAAQRGAQHAYLEVRRSNQVARQIYERFGFVIAGERLRYYKDNNEDALLMTLGQIQPQALQQFVAEEI